METFNIIESYLKSKPEADLNSTILRKLTKTPWKLCAKNLTPPFVSLTKFTSYNICQATNPSLIIFDQIDKLQGFKAERDDLLLGAKYQWARELAKQYGPVIGVCQADGQGENVRWLTMAHVANAKTAKQAEADFILGIGCIHDPGWESIRFLNISKNKLIGDGDTDPLLRHGKFQVALDPVIARYSDIT